MADDAKRHFFRSECSRSRFRDACVTVFGSSTGAIGMFLCGEFYEYAVFGHHFFKHRRIYTRVYMYGPLKFLHHECPSLNRSRPVTPVGKMGSFSHSFFSPSQAPKRVSTHRHDLLIVQGYNTASTITEHQRYQALRIRINLL